MLEIKDFFGSWEKVTKEQAERFYNFFMEHATAIKIREKHKYFNENHIRGGHVMLNGKIETEEEQKDRVFQHYKNRLKNDMTDNKLRFLVIKDVCRGLIDPMAMAVELMKDNIIIIYDDATISVEENKKIKKAVEKRYKAAA